MPDRVIYTGAAGINNRVPAHRLPFDGETGVAGLESAVDVVIDKTGQIVTRGGTTNVYSDYPCHSVHPIRNGQFLFAVDRPGPFNDTAIMLGLPQADGSLLVTGIWEGLTCGNRISWCTVAGDHYYSNGAGRAVINRNIVNIPWPSSEPDFKKTTHKYQVFPAGKFIDILSGSFLTCVDDTLIFSELGRFGHYRPSAHTRRFEHEITMVAAVQTGCFVSTTEQIFFAAGVDPTTWNFTEAYDFPAVPYCRTPGFVNPSDIGLDSTQLSVLFGTTAGPCIGLPSGEVYNLIHKNVALPKGCFAGTGAIMRVDDSLIIQSSRQ